MKKKVGDMDEKEFETLIVRIVRSVVNEIVEEKIEKTKPYWADKMMTALDKAAGNYKKIDQEQTLLSGRQSEHSDDIEDLTKRVGRIEKHTGLVATS